MLLISLSPAWSDSWLADLPASDAVTQQGELSGDWGFVWSEWVSIEQIRSGFDYKTVSLPNYLSDLIENPTDYDPVVQGKASYFKRIVNLDKAFEEPAIMMRYVSEAWTAYWITPEGLSWKLGQSGRIADSARDQILNDPFTILELPADESDGVLLIHTSAYQFDRSGLYSAVKIKEKTAIMRSLVIDVGSRAFLIGIGFFVVVQNLIFYLQRRKEKALILLSIFGLVGVSRAAFASGYVDQIITNPAMTIPITKIEYLLVIWPGVAALHYVCHLFPSGWTRKAPQIAYAVFFIVIAITIAIPPQLMSANLHYYQIVMGLVVISGMAVIIQGVIRGMPDSGYFLKSFVPLIIAVINDVIASRSSEYNFYMVEYGLFLFLYLQTQIQASRFVTALDTTEHLTKHLQQEVDLKTEELSQQNRILEDKAQILEAKHHEVKLLSQIDHLTGLYNRQTLESHAMQLFEMTRILGQPFSVVMMDIDHFKQVNDEFGHQVGDECLIFVASYLRGSNLRKRDLIARYGGEEMILLLTDTPLEAAQRIVSGLCAGLPQHAVQAESHEIHLTASFGIAEAQRSNAQSVEELIDFADRALYQAKEKGRNRVEIYSPDQHPNSD